jgi:hypothetical protein
MGANPAWWPALVLVLQAVIFKVRFVKPANTTLSPGYI